MNLAAFTLLFEAGLAVLLVVTIVYAVKLNLRISGLRERDSELRETIGRFNEASSQAEDSAVALKSAGVDAERQLRATIERGQSVRDELAFMIEHGDKIADRIERSPIQRRPAPGPVPGPAPGPESEAEPAGPSPRSAEDAAAESGEGAVEDRRYRSEMEQALANVIHSTAAGR